MWVYSTKARVDEYNYEHMVHLNAPAIQVEAKNQGKCAGQATSDNAGNLSNKSAVARGARVMFTTNFWQPAGLGNGAQGTIYDVAWNEGANPWQDPPDVIMVDFDNYDGPPHLITDEGRKIVPILPITRDFLVGSETCSRTQFPLIVAFVITVHKFQSLTKDQIVPDPATKDLQAGISYVAVSRVTSLKGLLLETPFDRQNLYNHTPTEGLYVCVSCVLRLWLATPYWGCNVWCFVRFRGSVFGASARRREGDNRVVEFLWHQRQWNCLREFPADTTWRLELVVLPTGKI